jgi:hypothetical protein
MAITPIGYELYGDGLARGRGGSSPPDGMRGMPFSFCSFFRAILISHLLNQKGTRKAFVDYDGHLGSM